jgi:hypothetical protein
MSFRKKILLAIGSVALLFFVVLGVVVPELIQRQAIRWVAENTERELRLEEVSFNPLNGKMTISGYQLTEPASEEIFLSYDRLIFDIDISSVWKQALIVDRLQLFNPAVKIAKINNSEFNFSDFYSARVESIEEETGEPLQFAISNFIIHGGSVDYRDLQKPDIAHTIRDLDVALPFVGNTPALADKFVQPRVSLKIDDAPFLVEGEAKPFADSLETSLQIKLEDIDLPFYAAYLPRKRPIDIASGKLNVDLDLSYKVTQDKETKLLLGGDIVLTGVSVLDEAGEKVFFLPLAQIAIDWADLLSRRTVVEQITIYGLEVFVNRDANGDWNHARLARHPVLAGDDDATSAENEAGVQEDTTAQPHIELGAFRFRNGVIHFQDNSGKKPFARLIKDIDIDLNDFDSQSGGVFPYRIGLHVTDPGSTLVGSVAVSGDVSLDPLQISAEVAIDKIQLAGMESYSPPESAGILTAGHFDTKLQVNLEVSDVTLVDVSGTAGLRALHLIEPVAKSDVLRWESLQLDGIDFRLSDGSPSLRISELILNNYLAKILVTDEGKVNLQHMLVEEETSEPEPESKIASVEQTEAGKRTEVDSPAKEAPAIAIDQITLQGGTLDFVDQHMPKNFTAKFLNLGGRISGIDSQSDKPAVVDLRGNLESRSPLTISGGIKPLGETLFADLQIRFDSIELTPMTPYSGNYLGYSIEKGKLYLDLDYKIDGDKLQAANAVFIDQFTFGQKVESEEATGLPVRLAVALLKDGQGEIHLDLPVTGSLNDPEFSVVGVVFTILKNLLVKAATSPFKLLASMLGGGGDDFSTVSFPYGVAALPVPEESKLTRLVDALEQRPTLKLEVSGYVDQEKDPEGLRKEQLESSLRQLKFNTLKRSGKLTKGATAQAMVLNETERIRYLKQVYKKADFPKPRNALGLVKSIPGPEMEKLILANTSAGEKEMLALAESRARVVYEYLVQVEKLPVERVFLKQDDIYKKPDDEGASGSRVGFGATVD